MKIEVEEDYSITLRDVFSGVGLKTEDGEFFGICMRDSGFEFQYQGIWYEAKGGVLQYMKMDRTKAEVISKDDIGCSNCGVNDYK